MASAGFTLKGGPDLQKRLLAIGTSFKPIGRRWADGTATVAKPMVPVRTGRLRQSIRRRNANKTKATVVGHYTAYFIDAGTKRHTIVPKKSKRLIFQAEGRTIFAKKVDHPRTTARPFRQRAADEGLRLADMPAVMIELWNRRRPAE